MSSEENRRAARPESVVFRVDGMDCAEEADLLRRELVPLVGEETLAFDYLNRKLTVHAMRGGITVDAILAAIKRTGLRAEPWRNPSVSPTSQPFSWLPTRTAITAICGVLWLAAWAIQIWSHRTESQLPTPTENWLFRALCLASIAVGGWPIAPRAWAALRRLRPDMNLLMTVAVIGAVLLGDWLEAATVTFLFSISLALESWSVSRARRAVAALLELTPLVVRTVDETGNEKSRPAAEIPVGTLFVVKPGEKFPLDGEVTTGQSDVNQAPITGESVPVAKQPGETVFAATINGDGQLTVRSTKTADSTTLARIIHQVTEAQSQRAPSEQWVERFARVYTPVMFATAILVALLPPLFLNQAVTLWTYRALVLLVIACPCALVISTPVTIVSALAAAARQGVLVKGGSHLEQAAHIQALALDKTGTLTVGRPQVVQVVPLNGHSETELLQRAAALEAGSLHPLAKAIIDHVRQQSLSYEPASDARTIPGKGAEGRWDGRLFWLGSHRWLEERGQETPEVHTQLESLTNAGFTVVVVGNEQHVCGMIALADTVRPGTREVLQSLRKAGVASIVMLTGDNRGTAEAIASQVGIDEFEAELLPDQKVAAVERLLARHGTVAMIGDGVNDAPALARATLGIAMGAIGSDAAIETADVALMSDDLTRLPWLFQHARHTLSIIRQNITFSLGIKALFAALTFWGWSSMWGAIAADAGASLLVVMNGLRLLRSSPAVESAN
ncbi:MAG: heavy metal translocating P-type ATPase [Planctomycetaceae bacterium]|nr:heavy metal translocating P-type ATPase [Planctomycetaceae bacterium]